MSSSQVIQVPIEYGPLSESTFSELLETRFSSSKKIILVDENTQLHCLERLISDFESLSKAEVIVFPAGEVNKTIDVAMQICLAFKDYEVGRNDVLINLGGGIVTDMGGFISSVYSRGIACIHIPTTLLGMVDASIGGKTGVDLEGAKNLIGTFYHPEAIYMDASFLLSLPDEEWKNGYAEMLKHALIADFSLWSRLKGITELRKEINVELIMECAAIKQQLVLKDSKETGERKFLNFGHTVGHAIESVFLETEHPISHGHAVALGIIAESYISMKIGTLSLQNYREVETHLRKCYDLITLSEEEMQNTVGYARLDKKNSLNKINVVLLQKIGQVDYVSEIPESLFLESLTKIIN